MFNRKKLLTTAGAAVAMLLSGAPQIAHAKKGFTITCDDNWVCVLKDKNGNPIQPPPVGHPPNPFEGDQMVLKFLEFKAVNTFDARTHGPAGHSEKPEAHGTHCWIQAGGTWYLTYC
jgi:hypothetical protein